MTMVTNHKAAEMRDQAEMSNNVQVAGHMLALLADRKKMLEALKGVQEYHGPHKAHAANVSFKTMMEPIDEILEAQ